MRLTNILWRWKKALPRGHIWRGKYRLYKEVTKEHIHSLRLRFDLEENNMFYLRHPYLTLEQSEIYEKYVQEKEMAMKKKDYFRSGLDHKYLGDRYGFLLVRDKWD